MADLKKVREGLDTKMSILEQEYERVKNDTTLSEEKRKVKLDRLASELIIADMQADERLYHRESAWEEDRRY